MANETIKKERLAVREYLNQYNDAKLRKIELETMLEGILQEFDSPLKSAGHDGMPRGSDVSLGAASLTYRLDEIEQRIVKQKETLNTVLQKVMDILDYLPAASLERRIFELRYIHGLDWESSYYHKDSICKRVRWSRTKVTDVEVAALDKLLSFERVREIVGLD